MQTEKYQAQLLSAESKPYNVDGNEGISHRIRFNVKGEIYSVKSTAEEVRKYEPLIGQVASLVIGLVSRKENLSLKIVSFEQEG